MVGALVHSVTPLGSGLAVRHAARGGGLQGPTSGLAHGFVQGNLAILPGEFAEDFLRFCILNPKPCPLIGVSERGDYAIRSLANDLDVRTDLPRYRIWQNGQVVDEPTNIERYWRDDLVAFVIGCSFSFEEALIEDGIPLRHIDDGVNVSMFRTNIPCVPAGPFSGPLVVTMRPLKPADAIRAIQITSRFPATHGAPVHIGFPEQIGIQNLSKPDYGDPVEVKTDEIPVFWACGVTPQAVIAAAKPPFVITHAPGSMLVTDLKNSRISTL
jgi:uncharacterized protein YcsI (UPF0317 family)